MATFAVINSGKVSNIIVADTKEIAEEVTGQLCVEYVDGTSVHIGFGWDESTGFEQPPVVVEEEPEVPAV